MPNLAMPGNPNYQPRSLQPFFGYDNLAMPMVEVEIATMKTLGALGIIPAATMELLTPEIEQKLLAIPMSEVRRVELEITSHDIRALVRLIQEILPEPLRPWAHIPLTSYDVLDTARIMLFIRVHDEVVRPRVKQFIKHLSAQAEKHAKTVQIGRTHGQHALPITVGFWLSTILSRALYNARQMDAFAKGLRGKISGPVGAYNAQVGLGFNQPHKGDFENLVLDRLELEPAQISTQILPPEPLAYYLFSCLMFSGTLGQFGRDCRNLMRTEIGELHEPYETGRVGSSTMANKRNPSNFENEEGQWWGDIAEFLKVLFTVISEHQRDLVGSSLMRDFPTPVIKMVYQLDTLLRPGRDDPRPFIERISVDIEACIRNLDMQGDFILAEPIYIALQMAGYPDAHKLINEQAMELAAHDDMGLLEAVRRFGREYPAVQEALDRIPEEVQKLFSDPARYTGRAADKVFEICDDAELYLVDP